MHLCVCVWMDGCTHVCKPACHTNSLAKMMRLVQTLHIILLNIRSQNNSDRKLHENLILELYSPSKRCDA